MPEMKVTEALQLLEVTPPVTIDKIKKQYRKMAIRYSPDISRTSTTEGLFRLVIEAHSFLLSNFNLFFNPKQPTQAKATSQPDHTSPPPKPKGWTTTVNYEGNWNVEIKGVGRLEIEKFNNGKSIRSITLLNPRVSPKLLQDYLDEERDEYEWFARIYGCSNQERDFLLNCNFSPWFPYDDPPRLTYLHRDLL
jgi:hypothetical protein